MLRSLTKFDRKEQRLQIVKIKQLIILMVQLYSVEGLSLLKEVELMGVLLGLI